MNTVKIGDAFEKKCYALIKDGIDSRRLGVVPTTAKVREKPKYYSSLRKADIIFDLSIEIWPEGADRYSNLYLIECKSSPKENKIPVDDVEEFSNKVNQVSVHNSKAIFITDTEMQKGACNVAESTGMMWIKVSSVGEPEYKLWKTEKETEQKVNSLDDLVISLLKKVLYPQKIEGLKKLSSNEIEEVTIGLLKELNDEQSSLNIANLIKYMDDKYRVKIYYNESLGDINNTKILGLFNASEKSIYIDDNIQPERFKFVLCHELGHFFLHKNLKVNQEVYDDFKDSEYSFESQKYKLVNDKNWIEWQANKFASNLLMPRGTFLEKFLQFRVGKLEIVNNPQYIYLDEQEDNKSYYNKTVEYLSKYFKVNKTNVKYRIEDLGLIIHSRDSRYQQNSKKDSINSLYKNIL